MLVGPSSSQRSAAWAARAVFALARRSVRACRTERVNSSVLGSAPPLARWNRK